MADPLVTPVANTTIVRDRVGLRLGEMLPGSADEGPGVPVTGSPVSATTIRITCPHCGDVTEHDMLLPQFTCGECDEPFAPVAASWRAASAFAVVPGTDIREIRSSHPEWTENKCRDEQSRAAVAGFKGMLGKKK